MKTQQPIWKFLGNLGDATPIDYGGFFVYEDTTGVYAPQAELLETPEEHVLERDERRKDKLERELRDQFESQNPEATEEQIEEYIKTNLVFEPEARWTVRRFDLDKCTYDAENDILSDNKFHPDHAAWFAKPERERAERPQDTTYWKTSRKPWERPRKS